MNATTNGRVRKSLAEQIDRLDRTLDGLSEGLNEAVATAVREAVQGVLAELLADAGLRAQIQATLRPSAPAVAPATAAPAPWRVRAGCRRLWNGVRERIQAVRQALRGIAVSSHNACRRQCDRMTGACTAAWQRLGTLAVTGWYGLQVARDALVALATALAVAGLVSLAAWYAGPTLAAAASGVSAFVTTLAVRTEGWLAGRCVCWALGPSSRWSTRNVSVARGGVPRQRRPPRCRWRCGLSVACCTRPQDVAARHCLSARHLIPRSVLSVVIEGQRISTSDAMVPVLYAGPFHRLAFHPSCLLPVIASSATD